LPAPDASGTGKNMLFISTFFTIAGKMKIICRQAIASASLPGHDY
jgi:hypothetical protein